VPVWDDFALHRLTAVPRPPQDPGKDDPTPAQLFAALTAAYAALGAAGGESALVVGRLRPEGARQITFLVGGCPWFPAVGDEPQDGEAAVLYPPGARGRPLPAADLDQMIASLPHWVACAGRPDSLWLTEGSARTSPLRGSFDDYIAHLQGGFAWIVVAEPVAPEAVDEELAALGLRIPLLRKKESSEQSRVDLERAEGRFRELSRSRVTGVWSVRVVVGAETAGAARSAAALLCSAGDLDDVPYVVVPGLETTTFADAIGKPVDRADGLRAPFTGSSELLLALARTPARELPGIRLVAPPCFDVTPELPDAAGVVLGDVLDEARRPAGPFGVPFATLNRHAFVCGATGSGKSQTMRTLLEGLARAPAPVPWLVIEPAKAEYAGMAGRLEGVADVIVIKPGDPDVPPASLNPLEPEPGFPLQSHADLVRALFLAAFEANEPFPQVLSRALTQVYVEAGWNLVTGQPRPTHKPKLYRSDPDVPATRRYPTLGQLQQTASAVVERIGYGKEITADVRGFVDVRMGSLREGTPGRFFEGGHPLDVGALLKGNVVLELEDITNDQDKAFLIGAVLIRIVEHLRVLKARGEIVAGLLRHVTVVEEAHRLLKNVEDGPAAAAVELFASLLAEIRAYGEGVVVVEQIPAKILPDVIKNSALKVMHRLPALDDRQAVGGTINLDPDQSELVVSFEPGVAAAAVDGMDRPVMVRVPLRDAHEADTDVVRRAPMLGPRSPLCAADCAAVPCTLRTINDNTHRSEDALVTLWVETVVVSFLIGEPPPLPAPAVVVALGDDPRDRRCTLVHAVERSVDVRAPFLTEWLDSGDLAAHVLATLERLLVGDTSEHGDWRRWTAGFFRWVEIRDALTRAHRAGRGPEPAHPDTAAWAAMGMPLDGPTLAGQLAQLRSHPSYAEGRQQFVVGDAARTGLLTAVHDLAGSSSPEGVIHALDRACRGHRADLLEPRIGDLLRKAEVAR
jgi:DNA helicase HerA-like ATPase